MIRKLLCWIGELIKKDWHDWETFCFSRSEHEPNLVYEMKKCKICGKIISVTRKVKR